MFQEDSSVYASPMILNATTSNGEARLVYQQRFHRKRKQFHYMSSASCPQHHVLGENDEGGCPRLLVSLVQSGEVQRCSQVPNTKQKQYMKLSKTIRYDQLKDPASVCQSFVPDTSKDAQRKSLVHPLLYLDTSDSSRIYLNYLKRRIHNTNSQNDIVNISPRPTNRRLGTNRLPRRPPQRPHEQILPPRALRTRNNNVHTRRSHVRATPAPRSTALCPRRRSLYVPFLFTLSKQPVSYLTHAPSIRHRRRVGRSR